MKKRLLGILLSFALILTMMPALCLSQTAYAGGTTYNPASSYSGFGDLITNDTEVTIREVSGKTWYVIGYYSSTKTVTLLSKESFAYKAFNSDTSKGNDYEKSEIKTYVDGLTGEGQPLAGISSVISYLTLIDKTTAEGLSETKKKGTGDDWWLRSPGPYGEAAFVYGESGTVTDGGIVGWEIGVRPAFTLDLSKVEFDSSTKTFSVIYPLWVGGTQVTSANASDVLNDGTVSYEASTNTLTLKGVDTTSANAKKGIYCDEDKDFTIVLESGKQNTVVGSEQGIYFDRSKKLTITGEGSLTTEGTTENDSAGIKSFGDITIEGGNVTASGVGCGIYSVGGNITINGGTVNANGEKLEGVLAKSVTINGGTVKVLNKEDNYNPAISGFETVTINGGNVTASSGSCGIQSGGVTINDGTVIATGTGANTSSGIYSGNGIVMIKGGNVVVTGKKYGTEGGGVTVEGGNVTAAGAARAIGIDSQGKLVNAIAGTGWTNTAGTEGKADIATGEHDAGALDDYKKVQFPAGSPAPSDTTPVGSVHNVGGSTYVVTSANTVSLVKAKSKKSVTLSATVNINGKTFNVTGIKAKAFKGTKCRTLTVKTKKLTKKSVKGSLKGSKIKKVKVKVGKKKENKKYVKKYKKYFTKKNCGKRVRVRR